MLREDTVQQLKQSEKTGLFRTLYKHIYTQYVKLLQHSAYCQTICLAI
jgi:hypothetical protein